MKLFNGKKSRINIDFLEYQSVFSRAFLPFLSVLCFFSAIPAFAQTKLENLAEIINHGNTEQKRDALFQIRNLESADSSRVALPALKDSAEIVRATAAFSIIYVPKDEAAANLLPLLQDKSELVRRETAYALGKVGNPDTVNPLLQVLQNDKIPEVRTASAIALGEIGDDSAINVLTGVLEKQPKDEEEFLRRCAARSLGQIAQNLLLREFIKQSPPASKIDEKVFAIFAGSTRPHLREKYPLFQKAVVILIQALQNPKESDDTKRESAFALGEIGDASAIPVLQSNLNAKDYYLAEICRKSLIKIQATADGSK